jgi:hypothetical protein
VEENAWRWTAKDFAVDLSPPLHADQKGAQLVVKLVVPDAVIQKLPSVQLSASIQGYKLEPQTYTKPGQYTYTRDVPADEFKANSQAMCAHRFLRRSHAAAHRERHTRIGNHRERSGPDREVAAKEP